jgi:hypothetical protein
MPNNLRMNLNCLALSGDVFMQACKKYRAVPTMEISHHAGKSNCENCVYYSQKNCMCHGGGAMQAFNENTNGFI